MSVLVSFLALLMRFQHFISPAPYVTIRKQKQWLRSAPRTCSQRLVSNTLINSIHKYRYEPVSAPDISRTPISPTQLMEHIKQKG